MTVILMHVALSRFRGENTFPSGILSKIYHKRLHGLFVLYYCITLYDTMVSIRTSVQLYKAIWSTIYILHLCF